MKTVYASIFIFLPLLIPHLSSAQTTEAGYACTDGRCVASAPKSNLMRMCEEMRSRAAWAQDWQCLNTRIFADNPVSRQPITNLRDKPESQLTDEERMILQAANRTGIINFCNKQKGGNAFLIEHNGRPAVVTSAHMLTDSSGALACSEADLRNSTYMPNTGHFDHRHPDRDKDFVLKEVGLEFPPINLEAVQTGQTIPLENDYVIFYLTEDITEDIMPGGEPRGFFRPASARPKKGSDLILMGMAADRQNGLTLNYQTNCQYDVYKTELSHTCDTLSGTSGSFLGHEENGEIVLRGLYNASFGNETMPTTPAAPGLWNKGLHIDAFL